jgi:hypothetical protein
MSIVNRRMAFAAAVGVLGLAMTAMAETDSGVTTRPGRIYVHDESKVSLKVSDGWSIVPAYRLRRTASSTVLGLEKQDPKLVATIIWSPLKRPFDEVIRDTADDRGDEYATLITVYKKEKVQRPTTMQIGPFKVFKVLIDGGPEKDESGALYLFETGKGDNRWKVKIRAVFPERDREAYIKQVEEVIGSFSQMP